MSLNPLRRTLCERDHVITQDAWRQEFLILVDGNGFVARFVNNDYGRYSSVSSMLTDLTWPSLQSWRRICDLGMFNKIHGGQVNICHPYDLTSVPAACSRTRASHDLKFRPPSSSVEAYKHSFSVPVRNALSADVVRLASYPEFIRRVSTTLTFQFNHGVYFHSM